MEKKLSYQCILHPLRTLQFIGYYQLSKDAPKKYRHFHSIYMKFVFIFVATWYSIQGLLKAVQVREDADKLVNVIYLQLSIWNTLSKLISFNRATDKIETILEIMRGPLFNQGKLEHAKFLGPAARHSYVFLRCFNLAALCTCLLWFIYPLILYLREKPFDFAVWFPIDEHKSPQFYYLSVYVWVVTTWIGLGNSTMDIFVSFLLVQGTTQLSILRYELENLVKNSEQEARATKSKFSVVVRERFRMIMLHYEEILRFFQLVQDSFDKLIVVHFLLSGWIICTTAYEMVELQVKSVAFLSNLFYMGCLLFENFIYCYYGNDLYLESNRIVYSVEEMDWLQLNWKQRKDLIIFLERVKRPILFKGYIIPLSNSTFVSILRSAYSFYALLRNVKH